MLAIFESPESWLIVAVVAILLFGSSKLPELARSLGRAKSEFQKGLREEDKPKEKTSSEEKQESDSD
jgi:sec-independent protein translocase protein TatA